MLGLLNRTVTIKRQTGSTKDAGGYTIPALTDLATGVPARIEPLSAREAAAVEATHAIVADYRAFLPVTDLTERDRIVGADGSLYDVRSVQRFDDELAAHHLEVLLQKVTG